MLLLVCYVIIFILISIWMRKVRENLHIKAEFIVSGLAGIGYLIVAIVMFLVVPREEKKVLQAFVFCKQHTGFNY